MPTNGRICKVMYLIPHRMGHQMGSAWGIAWGFGWRGKTARTWRTWPTLARPAPGAPGTPPVQQNQGIRPFVSGMLMIPHQMAHRIHRSRSRSRNSSVFFATLKNGRKRRLREHAKNDSKRQFLKAEGKKSRANGDCWQREAILGPSTVKNEQG